MSTEGKPKGPRFFARLVGFELSCPRCGKVYKVNTQTSRRIWDPRTCRFQCLSCWATMTLGVVAWGRKGGRWRMPSDTVPTVREALELRHSASLWAEVKLRRGADVNLLVDEGADEA